MCQWGGNGIRPGKLREELPKIAYGDQVSLSDHGFDLLSRMLEYDPKKRISARDALSHPFFHEHPHACRQQDMVSRPTRHELSLEERQRLRREYELKFKR
jgi:cell division cycle 2-like